MSAKIDRTGEVSYTKYGTKAVIVEYKSNKEVTVEFQDEYKHRYVVTYMNFKSGCMFNPFDRSVYSVGYMGTGEYSIVRKNDKVLLQCYSVWAKMLRRCYLENYKRDDSLLAYIGCTVCDEWHCFDTFAHWYLENKYDIGKELVNVDKDILVHGNKLYSPDTCLIVPRRINLLFEKSSAIRGDLPIGVSYYWHDNSRFLSSMKIGDRKSVQFGIFDTVEEAFIAYKNGKEKFIKEIADQYKSVIPQKIYDILYNYEVLITD